MKNEHILPNTLVPEDIRLEVYKTALDAVINKKTIAKSRSFGLCLILPCILWDLENCIDDQHPTGVEWKFQDTENMFPEIEGIAKEIYSLNDEDKFKLRIEYLENAIKTLTNTN